MNEQPPLVLPPPKRPDATWLRALGVMRAHPRETLLPIAVTQLPFAVITAVVFFYLFNSRYPDAKFDSFDWINTAPNGIRLTMVIVGAAQALFSLVGGGATMVSVAGIMRDKPVSLANALDPAFTRMGGLLLIGAIFYGIILISAIGIIVMLYFLIRWGLALQVHLLEEKPLIGSLSESWRILRGRMWSFFALLLTAIPFALILLIGLSILMAIAVAPFGTDPGRDVDLIYQSVAIFAVGVALIPVAAFLATSTTLFYLSAKEPNP